MVRIKLETLGAGLKSLDSGLSVLGRGALNVGELAVVLLPGMCQLCVIGTHASCPCTC